MAIPRNQIDIGEKLLSLKQKAEAQKAKYSELQGELKTLTKQMEREFGASSIEQAQKLLKKMEQEIKELEEKIKESVQEIEEMMEEDE
jgi:ribosomal protein S20